MRFEGKLHFRMANIGHPSENSSGKPCKDLFFCYIYNMCRKIHGPGNAYVKTGSIVHTFRYCSKEAATRSESRE